MDLKHIQQLKLVAFIEGDRENSELAVSMWHSNKNACEFQDSNCLTDNNIYFGTDDSREPKFCPYHYFKEGTGYKIEPK